MVLQHPVETNVAPRAGAWIETPPVPIHIISAWSPPARGRGLKRTPTRQLCGPRASPPARGRGLKHDPLCGLPFADGVAPRAGAWIETPLDGCSRPGAAVAPRAGAWIETGKNNQFPRVPESPPARGRGLKLKRCQAANAGFMSPPARGRGLKRAVRQACRQHSPVAPRAGAWIETA